MQYKSFVDSAAGSIMLIIYTMSVTGNSVNQEVDVIAARYPPGPKGQVLFGSLWDFNRRRLEFLTECARDYGDIVHARIGLKHFYILNHPDYIHQVLVKEPEKFEKGPQFK
jgi:hypothetical protein